MRNFQLFYVSRLAAALSLAQVRVLVGQAQMLNRRAGIGGTLTFTGNHFAQILEGPLQAVQTLAQRIAQDPRHTHFRIVQECTDLPAPEYRGWDMQLMDSPALDSEIARVLDQSGGAEGGAEILARIKQEARWLMGSGQMPFDAGVGI